MPLRQWRAIRYFGSDYIERHEKRSDDRLDYMLDMSRWLDVGEYITAVAAFTDPGDLVIDGLQFSGTRVLIWLRDGTDDIRHTVSITVGTSRGKTATAIFVMVTRDDPDTAVVVEKIGQLASSLPVPVRPWRRLSYLGINQMDRHEKRNDERLDYWLDLSRWLEPNETITAVRAWADSSAVSIPTLQFKGAWLVIWLAGGGYDARNLIKMRVTTSRGREASYDFVLVSRGDAQFPEYVPGTPAHAADIPVRTSRRLTYLGPVQMERHRKLSKEVLDYLLDVSGWLEPSERITAVDAWPSPDDLTVPRLLFSETKIVIWLAKGADRERFVVQLRITTSRGKVAILRFVMVTTGETGDMVMITLLDSSVKIGQFENRMPEPPEPVPAPKLSANPAALAFPATLQGQSSASMLVNVANTGDDTMSLRSMHITGDFSYTVLPKFNVAPGDSFPVQVIFKPKTVGSLSGTLQVDIGAGLQKVATLAGDGIAEVGFKRLSTSGNQFVTSSGTPVRLKSINWFGGESTNYTPHGTWQRAWRSIIDQIKTMGFNCIRLPFSGALTAAGRTPPPTAIDTTANADLVGLTALQILDLYVDYCLEKEIYIVLDHHRRVAGDGADGSPIGTGYTMADWKASWAVMANRYKDKPNVVGADIHNEPHDLAWNTWAGYVEECGNYIHTIAPGWIIFCEGVGSDNSGSYWWGGALGNVATRPVLLALPNRLAYSPHEYGQSVGTQSWLAYDGQSAPAGWPTNLYAVWKAHWGFIFEQNIAPVWIGEFGGKYGLTGTGAVNPVASPHGDFEKQWTANLCTYLNGDYTGDGTTDLPAGKLGMSFAYWSLNPNSGDTGGMLMDDWLTVQTVKRNLINPILAG